MFCPNCSKKISEDSKFCEYCGEKVSTNSGLNISQKKDKYQIPEERWAEICFYIAKELDGVRTKWFENAVKILESSQENKDFKNKIKIKNKNLGSDGEFAIKAYQLYQASSALSAKEYIPPERGRHFADLLYGYVCGKDIDQCIKYLKRYDEVAGDGGTQLSRISFDIAGYITGNPAPLIEGLLLTEYIVLLSFYSQAVVTEAFGDKETTEKLLQGADKFLNRRR